MTAQTATIRQGGALTVKADQLEIRQGGIALARTETAQMTAAAAGAILAGGEVKMDMSGARALLARGGVTMLQSGAVFMLARSIKAEKSGVVFLLAGKVEGDVQPVFGPRESAIFGAVAGVVAALILWLSRRAPKRG